MDQNQNFGIYNKNEYLIRDAAYFLSRNVYEKERDEFMDFKDEVQKVCIELDHPILGGLLDLVRCTHSEPCL